MTHLGVNSTKEVEGTLETTKHAEGNERHGRRHRCARAPGGSGDTVLLRRQDRPERPAGSAPSGQHPTAFPSDTIQVGVGGPAEDADLQQSCTMKVLAEVRPVGPGVGQRDLEHTDDHSSGKGRAFDWTSTCKRKLPLPNTTLSTKISPQTDHGFTCQNTCLLKKT